MKYPVREAPWLAFIRVCRRDRLSAMEKFRDKDRVNTENKGLGYNPKCFEGSEKYDEHSSGEFEPADNIQTTPRSLYPSLDGLTDDFKDLSIPDSSRTCQNFARPIGHGNWDHASSFKRGRSECFTT